MGLLLHGISFGWVIVGDGSDAFILLIEITLQHCGDRLLGI